MGGEKDLATTGSKDLSLKNPQAEVAFAQECANALMTVIESKPKKVIINGKQFLEFEDWQTIARFYGATVSVEWTKALVSDGKNGKIFAGYEARAIVLNNEGRELSAAEASCTVKETKWANRDRFQLRSMAQTRACAKAFRNVFSWVVALKGLAATPAEEMSEYDNNPYPNPTPEPAPVKAEVVAQQPAPTPAPAAQPATQASDQNPMSEKQASFIGRLLEEKGMTELEMLSELGKNSMEELSSKDASSAIELLQGK